MPEAGDTVLNPTLKRGQDVDKGVEHRMVSAAIHV